MARDDRAQVVSELRVERDCRGTWRGFREDLGNASAAAARRADDCDRPMIRFDHDLGAGPHAFQNGAGIIGEVGLGDVDSHTCHDNALFPLSCDDLAAVRSPALLRRGAPIAGTERTGGLHNGGRPAPADFDGDGKADLAIVEVPTGMFGSLRSAANNAAQYIYLPSTDELDVPVPADYDGDGTADPAVWRAATGLWTLLDSSTNYETPREYEFGRADHGHIAAPLDVDGDGKADLVVWGAVAGPDAGWWMTRSTQGYTGYQHVAWGVGEQGDRPVSLAAPELGCAYTVSPTTATLGWPGGPVVLAVSATHPFCGWTTASQVTWADVTPATGTGTGSAEAAVSANDTPWTRTGTLTVAGRPVTIQQAALPCTFSVSPTSVEAPAIGGAGGIALTVNNAACAWSATSGASWLTVSPASGSGSTTVALTAAPQSPFATSPRSGTVTIAGQSVTVYQAAPEPPPNPPDPDDPPPPPFPPSGPDEISFVHTDALGSVRVMTDSNQAIRARYEFTPWGNTEATDAGASTKQFAGMERDTGTGFGGWPLDYVGARHYQSQTGRFTSPDPITVNALRIVNPQRWNRYAYAVNNPLKYTDPDGLDALLINYTDGAHGLGHVGIMALNPDGSGLYGGFNPVNAGSLRDAGTVKNRSFPAGSIAFGAGGRPTIASLAALRMQLAKLDGKSPQAIRIRHIKTSAAETAALTKYIRSNINGPQRYVLGLNDCLDFCVRGLRSAGISAPDPGAILGGGIPDLYFSSFLLDLASRLAEQKPRVETSYCIQGIDCR
jgi:RHS repeat-associated protein